MSKKRDKSIKEFSKWQRELQVTSKKLAIMTKKRDEAFFELKVICGFIDISKDILGVPDGSPICKCKEHRHAGTQFASCKAVFCPLIQE
jgi:hypothetical protein